MKIDRLVGILSILLQKEKTTASELAEKFEVSRRTINRDIDDLCKAGIPIQTLRGFGGGISIMEGYSMDRTLLTTKDMQMILAGLRSLDSISNDNSSGQLMEKLRVDSSKIISKKDYILINLSSWHKESLAPKIEVIQSAIERKKLLEFMYYSPSQESFRSIEPYYLVFQWSNWYVWGWCCKKEDYRLFKLNRMEMISESNQEFEQRNIPLPDFSQETIFPNQFKIKAIFEPDMKWKLVEEFGLSSFTELANGKLFFEMDYPDLDYFAKWILPFGAKVEVVEPVELREILKQNAFEILQLYTSTKNND